MTLLNGRKLADERLDQIKLEVDFLNKKSVQPRLGVILVGENSASLIYIKNKQKACERTGILWEEFRFGEDVQTEEVIEKIEELNRDISIHGILVQLPLPKHINTPLVIRAIDPQKDVDGFHAYNLGKMFLSSDFEDLVPCTPAGIIKLLEEYQIPIEGQEVTVVGHSNIVGKPISTMLLNRNATVTTCHIFTKDLKEHTLNADILVVAVGKKGLITEDMVKEGATVIDVGINRLPEGKICGDVDFEKVEKKVKYITPVPGGVGPMTVACLMENVVKAAKRLAGSLLAD